MKLKQTIKTRLEKFPLLFNGVRAMRRALLPRPENPMSVQLQNRILKGLKGKKSVFFVQVGSNDGIQGDPLHELICANKQWTGVFIEPVDFLFERLKENYTHSDRFIFVNKAIAPQEGIIDFFYVSEEAKAKLGDDLPFWYDQLGSFDKNHIIKHLDGLLEPYILSKKIETVPLQHVFDEHNIQTIDLIHIDTEGYDFKVLSTLDFSIYKPSVILFEHQHLSDTELKSSESLLNNHGYHCVQFGGDTLATYQG